MNNYYIDPSAATNGNGTIDSPYNTWAALGTMTVISPFTIYIKRGTSERGNFNYSSMRNLVSTSDEQSFIIPYGEGANPVLIQDSPNDQVLHLVLRKTSLVLLDAFTNEMTQAADLVAISALAKTGDTSVDVWAYLCNFRSFPYTMQSQYVKGLSVYANRDVNMAANKLGAKNCTFDFLSRGVQVLGNYNTPPDQDTSSNVGDRYRSNGAVVDECSFTNMRDDGAILNRVTSPDSANYDTTNDLVSKISNCFYSSYRWNSENTDNFSQSPAVAFWTVYSNKTVIEYCEAAGSYAAHSDRMAFDFDIMTWDCRIRYCYSHNNAGGILLFISNADGDGGHTKPDGVSNKEWYVDKRWGQGNNIMHDCISFNDGTTRSASASGLWMSKFRYFGYASNCQVNNVTVIDTISSSRHCFIQQYPKFLSSDNVPNINLDRCMFYFHNLTNKDIIRGETAATSQGLTKFSNSNIYSKALGNNAFTLPAGADGGGNTQTDPMYEFIPKSAPSTFDSAKLIKMMKSSPYFGKVGFS